MDSNTIIIWGFNTPLAPIVAVVQSPSHVQFFVSPWTAARQASLSLTFSWSFPRFMFIASVMPCSHLIRGLSQCTGFECPASCIELGLVIYFIYGNIHVSMLFSQIIPLSPSPTESKSLFFTSVSLLLSCV